MKKLLRLLLLAFISASSVGVVFCMETFQVRSFGSTCSLESDLESRKIKCSSYADQMLANIYYNIWSQNINARLVAIMVGGDSRTESFLNYVRSICSEVNVDFELIKLPGYIQKEAIREVIYQKNDDPSVTGIFVQLPLPEYLGNSIQDIFNYITPDKDICCLSIINKLKFLGDRENFVACLPKAVMNLLWFSEQSFMGKKVVLISSSGMKEAFLEPLFKLFKRLGVDVLATTNCSPNKIQELVPKADILITAIGKENCIDPNLLKQNVFVIDCCFVGDVNIEGALPKVSKITPVGDGVEPIYVATLLQNLLDAYYLQANKLFNN